MSEPKALLMAPERLRRLRELGMMDASAEPAFDRLTRLAARLLHAPVALVSLVDDQRQFFLSSVGLPEPWNSARGTPLTHSFCQHVVNEARPLIIDDATQHSLVRQNLAIRDLGVMAYAGMPITTDDGHVLGSFCVIDAKPRHWSEDEITLLLELADFCSSEVGLREQVLQRQEVTRRLEALLAQSPAPVLTCDRHVRVVSWNAAAHLAFGHSPREAIGQMLPGLLFAPADLALAEERLGDLVVSGLTDLDFPPCLTRDGQLIRCRWTATPVHTPSGELDGFTAVVTPSCGVKTIAEMQRDLASLEATLAGYATSQPAAPEIAAMQTLIRSLSSRTAALGASLNPPA